MVRRPDHRRQHRRRGLLHHLRPRRVAEAEGRPLGRQRRRPGPRLAGRRQDLDERDRRTSRTCRTGARSRASSRRRSTPAPPTSSPTPIAWTTSSRTCGRRPTSARPGQSLTDKLPRDVYLHAVREDPKKKGLLYLGTERGVAYSTDAGTNWQPLKLNLPTVAVTICSQGQRSGRRHQRPLDLDSRRPHADPRMGTETARTSRRTCSPFSRRCVGGCRGGFPLHRVAARRESALRRDHSLLHRQEAGQARDARNPRRAGQAHRHVHGRGRQRQGR